MTALANSNLTRKQRFRLRKDKALISKLRAVLLREGKRKIHGPIVSISGVEYEELCDLIGAPK